MNKQRKVLITITYNEMGIIINTKAEEVEQPNLQPTCNRLATDTISRQAAIDAYGDWYYEEGTEEGFIGTVGQLLKMLPSIQPERIRCKDCKWYNDKDRTCNDLMGFGRRWEPDDFCSYGKRRTDD